MILTCRHLLDEDCFYQNFVLYAGNRGMDNRILWFYIDNTPVRQKLSVQAGENVGDLIFINQTFAKREWAEQLTYLSQCIKRNMAGIVIYGAAETDISPKLRKEAETKGFPVFLMKEKEAISQVTKTIARLIIQEENRDEYKTVFMGEILSGKLDSVPLILSRGHECDIDLNAPYLFLSLKIDVRKSKNSNESGRYYLETMHYILPQLEYLCSPLKILKYFSFERGVCLFSIRDMEEINTIRTTVDRFLKEYYKEHKVLIKAGYSGIHEGAEKLESAYNESQEAMQVAIKASVSVGSFCYEELGVLRFMTLLSKEDRKEMIEVAKKKMEPLIEYDSKNKTELLNTFHEYLRSDGNLIEASQNLYIHRNTLLKRLKKIEELLDRNIRDFQIKWDSYNSIYILKYFDII